MPLILKNIKIVPLLFFVIFTVKSIQCVHRGHQTIQQDYLKIAAAFHKQTGLLGRRNRQLCFKKKTDFVLPGMIRVSFGVCFKFACDDYNTFNIRNADFVGYISQSQKNF